MSRKKLFGLWMGVVLVVGVAMIADSVTRRNKRVICKDCSVVLMDIDTLRSDELECYGYPKKTAPNLCNFANRNVLFTNSYSQSSYTLASTFSLMTSLYPSHHGVVDLIKDILPQGATTLAEVLKRNDYETIYVGPQDDLTLPLDKGMGRGFENFYWGHAGEGWGDGLKKFSSVVEAGGRAFLFLHTYEVHAPYLPLRGETRMFTKNYYPDIPLDEDGFEAFTDETWETVKDKFRERINFGGTEESLRRDREIYQKFFEAKTLEEAAEIFEGLEDIEKYYFWNLTYLEKTDPSDKEIDKEKTAYLRALYDERIFMLDEKLSDVFELLERKPLGDKVIVVVTSDHGEEFGEHGKLVHGNNLYASVTRVPLIMRVSGVKKVKIDDLVQGIDVFPTILGLVGLEAPTHLEGVDLSRRIRGGVGGLANKYVVSELKDRRMISDGEWRLYANKGENPDELFNLVGDPDEKKNMIDEGLRIVKVLREELESRLDRPGPFTITPGEFPDWVDNLKREKLRKEGYF